MSIVAAGVCRWKVGGGERAVWQRVRAVSAEMPRHLYGERACVLWDCCGLAIKSEGGMSGARIRHTHTHTHTQCARVRSSCGGSEQYRFSRVSESRVRPSESAVCGWGVLCVCQWTEPMGSVMAAHALHRLESKPPARASSRPSRKAKTAAVAKLDTR
jgi:hypothetical protein